MSIAKEARKSLPTRGVCKALNMAPATFYRNLAIGNKLTSPIGPPQAFCKPPHHRALSSSERSTVLELLNSERFADLAPAQVYAQLLDKGIHYCSIRTMYRILAAASEVRERRHQRRHPKRTPPHLVATAPNQVWTWDITHLRTCNKGQTLKLYVALDLYSRYAVGWYLSETESAQEAKHFFEVLTERERIKEGQLIIHADNGSPMRGACVRTLYETLGITRSHSRPRTSNDNAFSESHFKTLKYCPSYPGRFDSIDEAKSWCRSFFVWYNCEHCHEGLGLLRPADVYGGKAQEILKRRAAVLEAAHTKHPERFVKGVPIPKNPPEKVIINAKSESQQNRSSKIEPQSLKTH